MRAIAYVRVSTRELDENNQKDAIKKYAKERGIEITKWYTDKGESGAKPFRERPEAQRLLNEIEETKPDAIIVFAIDRVGRTMLDTVQTILNFEERGIKVISVKEEWLQTLDTNMRKLILSILSWVAEFERKRIRERQLAAWESGKQKGRPQKVKDDIILDYFKRYGKWGKKYAWLRMREDGYELSYDRFVRRLKKLKV